MELFISCDNDKYIDEARKLAEHLKVELLSSPSGLDEALLLCYEEEGLTLRQGKLFMRGDLMDMYSRVKKDMWHHEMIAKAAKIKGKTEGLTAFDATAGMGEDSMILAAAGFEVTMYEYDPVIAALLMDSVERARRIPEIADIVSRMHVVEGDSIEALKNCDAKYDLIYLDPMFPERQKSGLIKKKFQLLQQLEMPCFNEEELLAAAINSKPMKIVIKRPLKGVYLAGKEPNYSYKGKAIRYDCFSFI